MELARGKFSKVMASPNNNNNESSLFEDGTEKHDCVEKSSGSKNEENNENEESEEEHKNENEENDKSEEDDEFPEKVDKSKKKRERDGKSLSHGTAADSKPPAQAGADWRKFKRLKRLQAQLSYNYKDEPALWGKRL